MTAALPEQPDPEQSDPQQPEQPQQPGHPFPEHPALRAGTAVATVLAAAVLAAMLGLRSGGVQTAVVLVGVALQVVLTGVRGLVRRREVRWGGGAWRWHQFVGAWSIEAGVTYLLAGDRSAVSAFAYVVVGLVFAAAVVAFDVVAERRAARRGERI